MMNHKIPGLLVLIILFSVQGTSCVTYRAFSFATLEGGQNSGVSEPEKVVAASEEEYVNLMNRIGRDEEEIEKIDFSRFQVIGVFLGEKSTGGYGISIIKLIETAKFLEVYVQKTEPEEGSMVTQALTSPYHIIVYPKTEKEIRFITPEDR